MVWWNPQQWAEVVERTPLVSIDLIVTNARSEVLLGWRNNKPAQHCWFVPGGVVRKGETLQQAFERVLWAELGVQAKLDRTNFLLGCMNTITQTTLRAPKAWVRTMWYWPTDWMRNNIC